MALNAKQEAFAQEVVKNGGDKVAARKSAGYSTKMNGDAQRVEANKLYNHPTVSLRIQELKKKADAIAEKKFSVSVEQRIRWLDEVAKAGLEKYADGNGTLRRENLNATNKAVDLLNDMLGIDEKGTAKPVKVIIGVQDAS